MADTKPTGLELLREPFPIEAVSKLPKNVAKDGQPSHCNVCGGYHRSAGIHLDYIGHATVTDRLLSVDPQWNWEPVAVDESGLPVFSDNGRGLWIRLTILGVTRLGYGSVESGKAEAVKELIGDAIRNAAMRFGVALDLWSKSDLESQVSDTPPPKLEAKADRSNVDRKTGAVKTSKYPPPANIKEAAEQQAQVNRDNAPPDLADKADVLALMKDYAKLNPDDKDTYNKAIADFGLIWPKTTKNVAKADFDKLHALLPEDTF